MKSGILLLEDGTSWEGSIFGASGEVFGEAVFNTAFSGYEEVLTDPSYAGQIVVMAIPHLGNYGISLEDMESSRCYLKGFVVKDASPIFSNWRAKESLQDFLSQQSVIGLADVDTRGIVKHLRQEGAMRAVLSSMGSTKNELLGKVKASPSMLGANWVKEVGIGKITHHKGPGERVVLYDFGSKENILRSLLKQNFDVHVLPASTKAEEAANLKPEGIVLSNGPGDPAVLGDIIQEVRKLLKMEIPTLGICLGNQLLGLSLGAKTYKLKFGHRGVNHPVKNLETGNIAITSHNHGFSIDAKSLGTTLVPTYQDLYDNTLEGFRHKEFPFIGIQFHPEAAPGPHDASPIFTEFKKLVAGKKGKG